MSLFSDSKVTARAGQFLVQLADAFGSSVQFSAERCDFLIGLLELQKLRNRRMHIESLAQGFDRLEKLRAERLLPTRVGIDDRFALNDVTQSERVYTLTIYNWCCR